MYFRLLFSRQVINIPCNLFSIASPLSEELGAINNEPMGQRERRFVSFAIPH
jgi:hypothetical protein